METLFNDSETFQKERPTKATAQQDKNFYLSCAKYCKENGFSDSDIEDITHDLSLLYPFNDNGFEMALKLDGYYTKGTYNRDTLFCEFLDTMDSDYRDILEDNVKTWAKAHNPKPSFKKGFELLIVKDLNYHNKAGGKLFVTGIRESTACYYLHEDKDNNGGYVIPYEKVESCCSVI